MKRRSIGKSGHIITARQRGQADRGILLLVVALCFIFVLCSAYAIYLQPENPAAWAMGAFFLIGLLILLGHEENVFPDITGKKLPYAVVVWFFGWIFIAYLIVFLFDMQLGNGFIVALFGIIVILGGAFVLSSETQWTNFKTKTKEKTSRKIHNRISKTKTGQKLEARKKRRVKIKAARKKKRRIKGW
jgi:hypothetical protein